MCEDFSIAFHPDLTSCRPAVCILTARVSWNVNFKIQTALTHVLFIQSDYISMLKQETLRVEISCYLFNYIIKILVVLIAR